MTNCYVAYTFFTDWVMSVAFSPDGSKIVSGSGDNTVRVWEVATGKLLQTLEGHSGSVTSVAFSPDGSDNAISTTSYSMDRSNTWIIKNGYRVLYIPIDFRPYSMAIYSSSIVMGAQSGRITILTFRQSIDHNVL
ncbi:hypothetical protein FQN57_003536 [Myotisia sp. PD_48]|nr:hypothetical protein FQN57_003536 [Myotisia sp. PD_48]